MGWGGVEPVEGEATLRHIDMNTMLLLLILYIKSMFGYTHIILCFLIMLQMSSGTPSRYGIHMWHGFIICEYMWYMFIWYRLYSPYTFQNLISDFLLKQRDSWGAFWSISLTFAQRCLTTWSPTLKVSRQVQATTASPDHTPDLPENHRLVVGKPFHF